RVGEGLAFVGPNGAGKTTLLRTLATLLPPLRGEIKYGGRDIREARRHIFFVPESIEVPLELKAVDYVKVVTSLYERPDPREVEAVLDLIEVPPRERLKNLSHGQRRRIQLAPALLVKTPIMLLDDPLIGLDYYATENIFPQIVKELLKTSTVIITLRHEYPHALKTLLKEIDITQYSHTKKSAG
ncbi:MAG: ATP-binding cassette domain-containing protein, partial [Pyrobaculum sp.]